MCQFSVHNLNFSIFIYRKSTLRMAETTSAHDDGWPAVTRDDHGGWQPATEMTVSDGSYDVWCKIPFQHVGIIFSGIRLDPNNSIEIAKN